MWSMKTNSTRAFVHAFNNHSINQYLSVKEIIFGQFMYTRLITIYSSITFYLVDLQFSISKFWLFFLENMEKES